MHNYRCYDSLQYYLLFPHGEMGEHEGIKKINHHNQPNKVVYIQNPTKLIMQEETGNGNRYVIS